MPNISFWLVVVLQRCFWREVWHSVNVTELRRLPYVRLDWRLDTWWSLKTMKSPFPHQGQSLPGRRAASLTKCHHLPPPRVLCTAAVTIFCGYCACLQKTCCEMAVNCSRAFKKIISKSESGLLYFLLHADCAVHRLSWSHYHLECVHCSFSQARWNLCELLCSGWFTSFFWPQETQIGSSLIAETVAVTGPWAGEYPAHRHNLNKCGSIGGLVWALTYG